MQVAQILLAIAGMFTLYRVQCCAKKLQGLPCERRENSGSYVIEKEEE